MAALDKSCLVVLGPIPFKDVNNDDGNGQTVISPPADMQTLSPPCRALPQAATRSC
jgi:hypothetical protein